jgi:zinc transport system substrate-binding protein
MILSALQAVDPAHHDAYAANYQALAGDIVALDMAIQDAFAGKKERRFMVFHPAWGYFAHTYGLTQIPIEVEGKSPKPAQLKALIEAARAAHISVIFVQPQFSAKSAQLVAKEIGGKVVFADPLAEDWMANLRGIADTFKTALR